MNDRHTACGAHKPHSRAQQRNVGSESYRRRGQSTTGSAALATAPRVGNILHQDRSITKCCSLADIRLLASCLLVHISMASSADYLTIDSLGQASPHCILSLRYMLSLREWASPRFSVPSFVIESESIMKTTHPFSGSVSFPFPSTLRLSCLVSRFCSFISLLSSPFRLGLAQWLLIFFSYVNKSSLTLLSHAICSISSAD
jgi:hypothetical protein